ncbi:MAG TPA: hypothetical protein VFT27_11800 [Actinomycetota bacterium]|nr:hypothetical protein [Actinomycetota bacterium]
MNRTTIRRAMVLAAVLALVVPARALGGEQLDPNLGDDVLGRAGGVRYASDSVTFDGISGYGQVDVGCGGPRWHLLGGGTRAIGPFSESWLAANRPLDFDDPDLAGDDGWYAGGYGPVGAEGLRGYTACVRDRTIRYRWVSMASDASGDRTGTIDCGGERWHLASGSAFIATSGSWTQSSYPADGDDEDRTPDDVWAGRVWDTVGGIGGFSMYAVCVKGSDLRYAWRSPATVAAGSSSDRNVRCRNDEHVVGGGARLSGAADQGRLVASVPYDDGDTDMVPDDGWRVRADNLSGSDEELRAFAICLG